MKLYCIDFEVLDRSLKPRECEYEGIHVFDKQDKIRKEKEKMLTEILERTTETWDLIERSMHLKSMVAIQKTISYKKFLKEFEEAMELYFSGDWTKAREKFANGLKFKEDDPPTLALLEFM